MSLDAVIDPDALLIGDVVQDKSTNKPMQIVGHPPHGADSFESVWNSSVNHELFNIDADSDVYRCVYLPKGDRYHLPHDTHEFPVERLQRVKSEYPTSDTRLQAITVRSILANIIAETHSNRGSEVASVIETAVSDTLPDEYADSIIELAEASRYKYSTD